MLPILILMFTVIPALELYLLFEVGSEIGAINTILVIIFTGFLGASLAKSQGLSILMKIQNKMNHGELPGDQIVQGLMVFAGGLLLLTPGFMTDIVGFSLVLPGTRHLLIGFVRKSIDQMMKSENVRFYHFQSGNFQSRGGFQSSSHFEQRVHDPNIIEADFTHKQD